MNDRVKMFGIEIDRVRMSDAVARVQQWIENPTGRCHYVVTPNVDHTVLLQESAAMREAYRDAELITADGFPVVMASKLLRRALPERVTGADLVTHLFDAHQSRRKLRVFLLGAAPGVADRAAVKVEAKWSNVEVVGCYSPPLGFDKDDAENARITQMVRESAADVLVVGLGAPKQELWVHKHQEQLGPTVALCVGATIDFLAGERPRAPRWMQRCGLEWFFRMMSDPRRLVKRYARDAWVFPQLCFRQWWAMARSREFNAPAG